MRAVLVIIRTLVGIAIASGIVSALASAEPAPAAGPQEVMADLSTRLFAALDKESATARHNAQKMLPLVDRLLAPNFDTEDAARLVLGLHWASATAEQRQQFAAALYGRLLRTYVGAVAEWTADRVKILPLRSDSAALQVTVRTQVTNSAGAVVPVDYRLRQTAAGWKIFDVVVEGISYVRNYHDDTDQEIAQKGLEAAIARLAGSDVGATRRESSADPAD